MTPQELLAAATRLMQRPDAASAGIWPRAAALLARQALELAMEAIWTATPQAAGLSGCSMRSQILCLAAYLDPDTATRAAYLTAALSHACQYDPYELAGPHASELSGWLDQAAQIVTVMQAVSAASASQG
jgi:hypothetical protein